MSGNQENIVKLNNVRLAFAELFQAKAVNPGDKPKFSCTLLLPPNHPDVAKVNAAIRAVATAKWGAKANDILTQLVAGNRVCLANGNAKANYDGFPGNYYINTRSDRAPLVIDADRSPLTQASGRPYSGCYVNAQIAVWAQDNQYGKRINAQIRGVQFYRDGDAFGGGGVAAVDDFDTVDDSADGDAPWGGDDSVLAGLLG
jgi:hypothetical protein